MPHVKVGEDIVLINVTLPRVSNQGLHNYVHTFFHSSNMLSSRDMISPAYL